ncbi:hypothetical protein BH11CYA1_BH11CYA1_01370 [soil metagenome]
MERTKLSKITKTPDQFVLLSVVEMASMIRSSVIALPFQAANLTLLVTCTFSFATTNVPRWCLYGSEAEDAPAVWCHDSADLEEVSVLLAKGLPPQAVAPIAPPTGDNDRRSQTTMAQPGVLPQPAVFDQASFDEYCKRLVDARSGMFAEGSFYWFLMQEFNRYQRTKLGFGIVLLSPCASLNQKDSLTHSREEVIAWLGTLAVAEVRKLDYICQFNGLIGMVLANSSLEESETCAQRIIEIAVSRNNSQRFDSGFDPHAGVANMPQTCEHPGILIAAAQQSLNQAISAKVPVSVFRL